MTSRTLFVSDLHLDEQRPEKLAAFLSLLEKAAGSNALYILGDLFEVWLGDDDSRDPHPEIIQGLRKLTASDTPVFVVRGNRDFLLGDRFVSESGVTLLDDTTVIDLYGEPTLIMHGDLLCTSDHDYQTFRQMFSDPAWQRQQLQKPFAERLAIAQHMRAESQRANQNKTESIMDVEQSSVKKILRKNSVHKLIHGHTHRPGVHEFELDGQTARRTVLNDWYTNDGVLVCTVEGQTLVKVAELG